MVHTAEDATVAERLLDRLYSESDYRYPRDFQPSICGINAGSDAIIRRQICVGAQWLHDNPDESVDGDKFYKFIESMDAFVGHSAASYASLQGHLSAIKEKGFGKYIEELREQRAESAVSR